MAHRSSHAISRRTAANLLRNTSIAPHVMRETVQITKSTAPVLKCVSHREKEAAGIDLYTGDVYYLVASKFSCRYFVLKVDENMNWTSSSSSDRATSGLIAMIYAYEMRRGGRLGTAGHAA